jgi:hypothetical protein
VENCPLTIIAIFGFYLFLWSELSALLMLNILLIDHHAVMSLEGRIRFSHTSEKMSLLFVTLDSRALSDVKIPGSLY